VSKVAAGAVSFFFLDFCEKALSGEKAKAILIKEG
jgi:hypothetical protein